MTDEITNNLDIIDSRDVIARIEELTNDRAALVEAAEEAEENMGSGSSQDAHEFSQAKRELEEWDEEYSDELVALEALAEEASAYAPDWQYGEALIRETYFEEYAEQLAEDLGVSSKDNAWPLNHIDWEAAAEELKVDYTEVDFDGVPYFIR